MKNEEKLLRSIGSIDDSYVLEGMRGDAKPSARFGKKKILSLVAVLALAAGLGHLTGGLRMGAAKSSAPMAAQGYYASDIRGLNSSDAVYEMEMPAAADEGIMDENNYKGEPDMPMEAPAGAPAPDPEMLPAGNTKLIYTANVSIQAVEYEKAVEDVKTLTESFGGYIQSSYEYNGGLNSDGSYKTGSFSLRIPSQNYRAFMNSIGDNCHVVDCSEQVEDISLQYSEMEGRLENLKIKQERLQELLRKADNMSDIIQIENELSNVDYSIEYFTTGLNRYDSLVNYSTVSVNITKVSRIGDGVAEDPGFFARLARAFKYGIESFLDGLQGMIIDLAYSLPWIVLLIIAVWLILKSAPGKALRRAVINALARRGIL